MARITVEDCLVNQLNRFTLVRLTAKRAKQILAGDQTATDTKGNRPVVSALREIAAGKVVFSSLVEPVENIEVDSSNSESPHAENSHH